MSDFTSPIRAIIDRREAIAGEIDRLRSKINELQDELDELETAARVLHRLGVGDRPTITADQSASVDPASRMRPPVPVTDMIMSVLRDFTHLGIDVVERAQLVREVTTRWPSVSNDTLRQTIWRLAKEGKIEQADNHFALPRSVQHPHENENGTPVEEGAVS